jgi:hypothetical protein
MASTHKGKAGVRHIGYKSIDMWDVTERGVWIARHGSGDQEYVLIMAGSWSSVSTLAEAEPCFVVDIDARSRVWIDLRLLQYGLSRALIAGTLEIRSIVLAGYAGASGEKQYYQDAEGPATHEPDPVHGTFRGRFVFL